MENEIKKAKTKVLAFAADPQLIKRIRIDAVRLDRDESFIIRLILRKHYGLKETGTL